MSEEKLKTTSPESNDSVPAGDVVPESRSDIRDPDFEGMYECPACAADAVARGDGITKQSVERSGKDDMAVPSVTEEPSPDAPDYEGLYKRALADYQNLQKDFAKERERMRAWALQDVVERLLPVLDNFSAAVEHRPDLSSGERGTGNVPVAGLYPDAPMKKLEGWFTGVEMIKKQMEDLLADFGVKKVEAVGKPFDPSLMEAVGEEEIEKPPSSKEGAGGVTSGTVLRVTQEGYTLGGTLIRPAKVITVK